MRHIQGTSLTGYVTISVTGQNPELFFQECSNEDVLVWNIRKVSEKVCEGNVKLNKLKTVKQIEKLTGYQINVVDKKGYLFLLITILKKKEALIAFIISCLFIVFLSNIIWEVKVTGVPKETEEKIAVLLNDYGIYVGKWAFTIDTPGTIQNKLIGDMPELLWVGVHKKGTTFILEGVEKTIVKKKITHGPRNLVANKNGVITSMYVSKGLPLVKVNDYVQRGDILVSGIIDIDENNKAEEDNNENREIVAAEGEVKASTWYEVTVAVPLKANHEIITGNKEKKHHIQMGKLRLPIWGFGKSSYEQVYTEENKDALYFFKWKSPIKVINTVLSEKIYNEVDRTKNEAIDIGIKQAKNELKLKHGLNIKILNEKILHESTESGKVNLILYFNVEENIVQEKPITQGD